MPQRLPARLPAFLLPLLLLALLAGCGGTVATVSGALPPTASAASIPAASARPTGSVGASAAPAARTVTGGAAPGVPPGLAATATAVAAIPVPSSLPAASAAPTGPPAKVGERVVIGGTALTLNAKQDNAPSDALPPPAGSRRYIVSLTIENVGTASVLYSALFATIVLTDDSGVTVTFDTYPTPLLAGGALDPGDTTRGWLTFDLPASAIPARLVYDDPDGVATFDLK